MARAQRPSDHRSSRRRPGSGSGAIRRGDELPRRTPRPQERSEREHAPTAREARRGASAHPEAHRLTNRTDTSDSVLGPRTYTPRRIGLLAAISIVLLVTVSFPLRNHYEFLGEQKKVAQDRAALERTIADLQAQQAKLNDPAFIEEQARIRFGAVKPGETPYRISPVDPVLKAEQERQAAEKAAQPWQSRLWNSIALPPEPVTAPPGGPTR